MQLRQTIPLTSVLSPKGRGSKPSLENESPFGECDSQSGNDPIPSPLGGEGRVRGAFNCMDTTKENEKLEAGVGIEPTHKSFADSCLTTWLTRHRKRAAK